MSTPSKQILSRAENRGYAARHSLRPEGATHTTPPVAHADLDWELCPYIHEQLRQAWAKGWRDADQICARVAKRAAQRAAQRK